MYAVCVCVYVRVHACIPGCDGTEPSRAVDDGVHGLGALRVPDYTAADTHVWQSNTAVWHNPTTPLSFAKHCHCFCFPLFVCNLKKNSVCASSVYASVRVDVQ